MSVHLKSAHSKVRTEILIMKTFNHVLTFPAAGWLTLAKFTIYFPCILIVKVEKILKQGVAIKHKTLINQS